MFGVPLLNRNGPVPIMPLETHVPGLLAIAAGWMIAWYDVWLTRYGNDAGRRREAELDRVRPSS